MAYIHSLFIFLMENADSTHMYVCVCLYIYIYIYIYIYTYILTYLLHGAESFLRS